MSTLIIDQRNVSLDYEGDCLLIRQPDHPPRSVPLPRLQRILCMHSVNVATRLIGHCQRLGVDFIVINARHSAHSFAVHANHLRQAQRRVGQYRLTSEPELALPVAQRLVRHKLAVARRLLEGADSQAVHEELIRQSRAVQACADAEALRGHEGVAQRRLFEHWRQCLPAELGFTSRQRRPPPDPVNALLSLTFTLIHEEAVRQCLQHGLDPWLGFYHQLAAGRMSLACDLMEPLRPLVEAWVVRLFVEGELDRRHFAQRDGGCLLGKAGRELYYGLWHAQLPAWSHRLGRYAALLARHVDSQASNFPALQPQE